MSLNENEVLSMDEMNEHATQEATPVVDDLELENAQAETENAVSDAVLKAEEEAGDLAELDEEAPTKKPRKRATKKKTDVVLDSIEPEDGNIAEPDCVDNEVPIENDAGVEENTQPSARRLKAARRTAQIERAEANAEREAAVASRQKFHSGVSAIQEAMRRHQILHGSIGAVTTISARDTNANLKIDQVYFCVAVENGFIVRIPFDEFFRDDAIDMSTVTLASKEGREDYVRRQRQLAEKMYGAQVSFVVTFAEFTSPDDYMILGSRKQALEVYERRNYIGLSGGIEPRYKKGDMVKGQVLAVGVHSLRVYADGVDVTVPVHALTFRFANNLEALYSVGDTILFEIADIRTRTDGRISLSLDARRAELNDAKQRMRIVPIGTRTVGTIVSVRPSKRSPNKIVIYAWLDAFDLPAVVRSLDPKFLAATPIAGDKVRLEVYDYAEGGFVRTRCTGFHHVSVLFGR